MHSTLHIKARFFFGSHENVLSTRGYLYHVSLCVSVKHLLNRSIFSLICSSPIVCYNTDTKYVCVCVLLQGEHDELEKVIIKIFFLYS